MAVSSGTAENFDRMDQKEKINHCVEKGSLVIGLGIITGTLTAVILASPFPIYAGTTIGYALAIDFCYKYFKRKRTGSSSSVSPCEEIYTKDDKVLSQHCMKLPSITQFGKDCIDIKEKERKKDTISNTSCKGSKSDDNRFKKPDLYNCMSRPCLQHDKQDIKVDEYINKIRSMGFPLKRFTNPLSKSQVLSPIEAAKESYRSYPLKRFTNSKRVIQFPQQSNAKTNKIMINSL